MAAAGLLAGRKISGTLHSLKNGAGAQGIQQLAMVAEAGVDRELQATTVIRTRELQRTHCLLLLFQNLVDGGQQCLVASAKNIVSQHQRLKAYTVLQPPEQEQRKQC